MDNREFNNQESRFLGSGWSFPVQFSAGNFEVKITSYEKNVKEALNIILLTKNGERTMEPDFGLGLQQFYFRKMDETLKGEIIDVVKTAFLHNEPRITVNEVSVDFIDFKTGSVAINVKYVYNQTNTRHNYVFPFHLNEGTNLS